MNAYAFVGESYATARHLDDAHRWYTMATVRLDRLDGDIGAERQVLAGRYRMRRRLTLPLDEYEVYLESYAQEQGIDIAALVDAMRSRTGISSFIR